MATLVQIGAGNIGRSFVGQLFARAGYDVAFVDIDDDLVAALNRRHAYTVEIRDTVCQTITVENVRAINARRRDEASLEIARADIAATAVGQKSLGDVYPLIALAIRRRWEAGGGPLDIIICENVRNAADAFRSGLARHLPDDFPLTDMVGLVQTSIGKMVPLTTDQQRREDPLRVFAEAYNTLVCDGTAFKTGVPAVPGLDAKQNITAYVDRKIFVHNLGHAATAYFAHLLVPGAIYVWQAIADHRILVAARGAMWESGRALIAEYPQDFAPSNIGTTIEDLLRRFANKSLGDAIYRVGRDLPRKLGPGDRLIGSLRLADKHKVSAPLTAAATAAGMLFRGTDEHGQLFPADEAFACQLQAHGPEYALKVVCGLNFTREQDRRMATAVLGVYRDILRARASGQPWSPLGT